jgi:hypothetical protein
MARYNRAMEFYNYPLRLETISRYVREGKLTEREALLLRGTASTRGFRGGLQESITWLENFSPGVSARFYTFNRGWTRNTEPMRAKRESLKIQGRLRYSPGVPRPSSRDRCTAHNRQGERCGQYAHPKGDGTRYATCWWHGGPAGKFGHLSGRYVMRHDSATGTFRKMWTPIRRSQP